jgi:two-component system, OmpR family, response regulator
MAEKVLIVEDDETLLGVLKYNLVKAGYSVITAQDGRQAIQSAREGKPDVIVLDLMLPEMDGLEVTRVLRKDLNTPILILTARAEEIDKIVGLEVGADDYLTKPFSMRELLARVKALLRRSEMSREDQAQGSRAESAIIRGGDIEIDISRHIVRVRGNSLETTPKEFDLLAFLIRNQGQVFSREKLLEKIWGYEYAGDTRTVDVHIRWLRQKVEEHPDHPVILATVRGVGYKFEAK